MHQFTSLSGATDTLCNKLNTLYSQIRLYADMGVSGSPGNDSIETTLTTVYRTMDHLAAQVEEISSCAQLIQDWVYGKNRQPETEKQ